MNDNKPIDLFIEHVLVVANKFIDKVNSGRARSKETYADLQKIKKEAIALKLENWTEEILQQAVKKWGIDFQMMMAQEECGELIAAISQFKRGRKDKKQLAEEIADVEIMCSQLRIIIGHNIVDVEKLKKICRLERTIKC